MRMIQRMFIAVAALFAAMAPLVSYADGEKRPMALVVMVDGLRADAIESGEMPNVERLREGKWQVGYKAAWTLSASTIRDGTTESAPNHVAIATGMTVTKTKIKWNPDLISRGTNAKYLPTWLVRLTKARKDLKALHIFRWYGDLRLSPDYGVQFIFDRDDTNAKTLAKLLSFSDAPDAIMWYIDRPDHPGHNHGYYPYSTEYKDAVRESDGYVGEVLAAIAARPTFADEDWLIIVTADHGGWEHWHGQSSTQCYTIPLIIAGRHVAQGRIPGVPHNYDAAPTALAHFGIDVSKVNFDGKVRGGEVVQEPAPRPIEDGRAVYLPFTDGSLANKGSADVVAEIRGAAAPVADGAIGGGLRISASTNSTGCVFLKGSERLAFEKGAEFGFAVWVRTFGPQVGDPVVFANKNWSAGSNPGIALIAERSVPIKYGYKIRGDKPGVMFNCGCVGKQREDLGQYNPEHGEWTFYAMTRGADGVVRFYQGRQDGNLHCVADDLSDIAFKTGLPFFLGQDGTGKYRHPFVGDIDEFSLWTRTLSHEEVRRLFELVKMRAK